MKCRRGEVILQKDQGKDTIASIISVQKSQSKPVIKKKSGTLRITIILRMRTNQLNKKTLGQ